MLLGQDEVVCKEKVCCWVRMRLVYKEEVCCWVRIRLVCKEKVCVAGSGLGWFVRRRCAAGAG